MAKKPENDSYNETFPTRLRALMRENNVTQADLGAALGVTRQAISNYMAGISSPDWQGLAKIAKFFSVTTDYLVGLSFVSSGRLDVQSACESIGITEKACETLRDIVWDFRGSLSSADSEAFDASLISVNHFLESAWCRDFFNDYQELLFTSDGLEWSIQKGDSKKIEVDMKDLRLAIFEFYETAVECAKSSCNAEILLKKAKVAINGEYQED